MSHSSCPNGSLLSSSLYSSRVRSFSLSLLLLPSLSLFLSPSLSLLLFSSLSLLHLPPSSSFSHPPSPPSSFTCSGAGLWVGPAVHIHRAPALGHDGSAGSHREAPSVQAHHHHRINPQVRLLVPLSLYPKHCHCIQSTVQHSSVLSATVLLAAKLKRYTRTIIIIAPCGMPFLVTVSV